MANASPQGLVARVVENALSSGLLAPGAHVLVAVSGGRDSAALAGVLAAGCVRLPLALTLAHVDHGWRGAKEAAADGACVAALAQTLDLPLVIQGPPPEALPHTEDAARRFRYRMLAEAAREARATHIAIGHHAGDQAETVLMRLLRGSGLVGLTGIPAKRALAPGDLTVVRPLLSEDPESLAAWAQEHELPWREDPTNADLSRDRAAIRARLARRPARGRRSLLSLAARARERLDERLAWIDAVAASRFEHYPHADAVAMPRSALEALHGDDLALALRRAGAFLQADHAGPWFTRTHVARIETLLVRGGALDLPRGLHLHVAGARAWLARRERRAVRLPVPAVRVLAANDFDLEAWRDSASSHESALDADRLGPAPTMRLLQGGDVFTPLGSSNRRQSVTQWLSRSGMPGLARRGQPVLVGEHGVAWVVGTRLDAEHAVTAATRRVALVRLESPAATQAPKA